LCGMEQARRSALAHHVHRTAPMGPRVLINGIWYNPSQALDQAREVAIADARRKAEVYTHASGVRLGQVKWIIEDGGVVLPVPMRAQAGSASMAAPVPIATGEDTLRVKITVGFEIAP
jgi:uncharacterized protein YggE